jgi:hypothetical protein
MSVYQSILIWPTGVLIGAVSELLKGWTVLSPNPMADVKAAIEVPYCASLASRLCAALH